MDSGLITMNGTRGKCDAFIILVMTICIAMAAFALVAVTPAGAQSRAKGGNRKVTFAENVGEPPNYFFPMETATYWNPGHVPWASYLMWPPLYTWGKDGHLVFNETKSLAKNPVFRTNATGDTIITITLKRRYWSTGKPLTTRDVEFWVNLMSANKTTVAFHVPGEFPTNVKKFSYVSPTKFQMVLNAKYDNLWLEGSELTSITPIPQQAWDKTSTSSPVGTYDLTTSGAKAVYDYLQKQATTISTFSTNPLWKVVDGPFEISSYDVTNGGMTLVPNPRYNGPKSRNEISSFEEVPYTSATSELDALESGALDVGYVPLTSLGAIPKLESEGYKITTWIQAAWGGLMLQYNQKNSSTAIIKQQYFRAALTHMLTMGAIIKKIFHGRGAYSSGPVPNPSGHTALVAASEKKDPYPFSIVEAKKLLTDHGWRIIPTGTSRCVKPGTAANECGSGIPKGAKLRFTAIGTETVSQTYEALQYIDSQFSLIGVKMVPKLVTSNELVADPGTCVGAKTCAFSMEVALAFWPLGWPTDYPSGQISFYCGSSGNYRALCTAHDDKLIVGTEKQATGKRSLMRWEDYMVKQQFMIFLPVPPYRVVAYKKDIRGLRPLTPYLFIDPEMWSVAK